MKKVEKTLRYLAQHKNDVCSTNVLKYMRTAFEAHNIPVQEPSLLSQGRGKVLCKILKKLSMLRTIVDGSRFAYITPVLYLGNEHTFPFCYYSELIPYSFDCWPRHWDLWESFYKRNRIKVAFISAKQSVEEMQRRVPTTKFIWEPESVDPDYYLHALPLSERTFDVLELGRKYDRLHNQIKEGLNASGKKHLYEIIKGKIIFPSFQEFVEGLANTKLSICFPASVTHPETAGVVETVTERYFQSIAAKCIPYGKCPAELQEMFGYNPCIEANMASPFEQIEEILDNVQAYQPLVERNYQRLIQVATWSIRAENMIATLNELDYKITAEQQ